MKILVACEFSGIVRDAFSALGHDATSCDLLPTERPGKHHQGDVRDILGDGWDLMIGHPPCDHLAVSGNAHFQKKRADGRQQSAIKFFMELVNAPIKSIAIENPIGIMSTEYRRPDQIIQPYFFGDAERKPTCIWLKNLPPIQWSMADNLFEKRTAVTPRIITMQSKKTKRIRRYSEFEYLASCNHKERKHIRSRTFPGIARAMAEQWGGSIISKITTA